MPLVRYVLQTSPSVSTPLREFRKEVARVLSDPRGWRKYGYVFAETRGAQPAHVMIRLETAGDAQRLCGTTSGLSCQRERERDIVISEKNWLGGSRSSLPLDRYHNYVITHEVGHFLGLEHQRCPWAECRRRGMAVCPGSVMQQMSRGPGHVAPCVESDWPLDPDWRIDDPRPAAAERPRGAAATSLLLLLLLAAIGLGFGAVQLDGWQRSNSGIGGRKNSPPAHPKSETPVPFRP